MGASTMARMKRLLNDDRGELEDLPGLAILLVGIICPLLAVVLFMGRFGLAANSVQSAAAAAARDASLSRSSTEAIPHARTAAEIALEGNVDCVPLDVTIGGNGLSTRLGETGTVSATITCTISNSDLAFPLIPGTTTVIRTAISPVDPYRQR
jgi:hypothetical protein